MSGKLEWDGEKVRSAIEVEMRRRVNACTVLVSNEAKRLLSVAGTGKKGKKTVYGANPSAPGEPPHKQTGRLRGSVAREVIGLVGRVGTNVLYGRHLELGTRKMAARPWLRVALRNMRSAIVAILSRPIK